MSVVINETLVITSGRNINANNPLLCYHNLVSINNVSTSTAATGFPATNLANPASYAYAAWRAGSTAEQLVTVTLGVGQSESDYVALARHNLGSASIKMSIEATIDGTNWSTVIPQLQLGNDAPRIFRFTKASYAGVRLRLASGLSAPQIAVLFVGLSFILPHRLFVGHAPINLQEQYSATNGFSEQGDFLGRIVLGVSAATTISLKNLNQYWVRSYFKPFMDASAEQCFFFAWRPDNHPLEIGYCWLSSSPKPTNQLANGFMQVDISVGGIVR